MNIKEIKISRGFTPLEITGVKKKDKESPKRSRPFRKKDGAYGAGKSLTEQVPLEITGGKKKNKKNPKGPRPFWKKGGACWTGKYLTGFKYFLVSFLLSFWFFAGINYFQEKLEDFFFLEETKKFSLEARVDQNSWEELKPFRNWKIDEPEIEAKAVLSIFFDKEGRTRTLFAENSHQRLRIASLAKLMTALIALENYELSQIIETPRGLTRENNRLREGEKFTVKDLLYFLLITSDNGAAQALAKEMGFESFIFLMNRKAHKLGMENTFFVNPTGLDPDSPQGVGNFSTAKDLVILGKAAFERPLILEILATPKIRIYSRKNFTLYELENTNRLLDAFPETLIIGKTGQTPQAKECLMTTIKAPQNKGKIISVILGSDNRFKETKELLDWIKKAYIF